ncbi:13461_t:CDS:2, partial [Funneliformis geosporum]
VRDQEINVIKVEIDKEGGQFSVFNNGKGIYDENFYLNLSFRNLFILNFNDDLKKVSGGRNGFGAKLTNIFSDHTLVKFRPDFQKFQMSRFDDDIIFLIKKRVYGLAGGRFEDVKVFLNDEQRHQLF